MLEHDVPEQLAIGSSVFEQHEPKQCEPEQHDPEQLISESVSHEAKQSHDVMFKKYCSIENTSSGQYIRRVLKHYPDFDNVECVVMEKAHGAHFSFQTDGHLIECARRNDVLKNKETFFDWQDMRESYSDAVIQIFKLVKDKNINTTIVQIDGELIGGKYPHEEIPNFKKLNVQTGIWYCPEYQFYAYDIRYCDDSNTWTYMDYDETFQIFAKIEMLHALPLARGIFKDVKKYDPLFETTIPGLLWLPSILNNIAEGVVIKPVKTMYLPNGARVIFKHKNENYTEIMPKRKREQDENSNKNKLVSVLDVLTSMVVQNRLDNVLSQIGFDDRSNTKKLTQLLMDDVFDEWKREHDIELLNFNKKGKKTIKGTLKNLCSKLVCDHMKILE